jgi:DNA-binding MurR/RpiR family transcriptional regulator
MARVKHLALSKAGCQIRIKSAMDSFKPSERTIAEFVIKNPERVVQMSISDLARDVEVGESTSCATAARLITRGSKLASGWVAMPKS